MSIQPAHSIRGSRLTAITQTVIVGAMAVCVSLALVQFGQKIVAAWRVDYIPVLSLSVALIAATTTRGLRQPNLPLPWYVLRAVELIALFLVARSVLGILRGPDFVVKYDAFYGGIDNELFALVAVLGVMWLLSWQLTRCLLDVAGAVPLADRDLMQDLDNERQAARQTLSMTILGAGIAMVLLNAVIRMSLRNSGALAEAARVPVAHLLIYFGLGLILLSHTRLTVLAIGLGVGTSGRFARPAFRLVRGDAADSGQHGAGRAGFAHTIFAGLVWHVELSAHTAGVHRAVDFLLHRFSCRRVFKPVFPANRSTRAPAPAAATAHRDNTGGERRAACHLGICAVVDLLGRLLERDRLLDLSIHAPQSRVDGSDSAPAGLGDGLRECGSGCADCWVD